MAARFVLAIAADGKIRVMRQGREDVERLARVRRGHLRAVLAREGLPLRVAFGRHAELERGCARREHRVPDVVEIPPGELAFRHAAWRATHGAEARAFT